MRKFLTFIVYTLVLLLIGRNLSFLPKLPSLATHTTIDPSYQQAVENIIAQQKGSYSVVVSDLSTNTPLVTIHDEQIHTAASVNKAPIIATLYYLAQRGKINLDDRITIQKNDIQDYGTGSLRYEKPGESYSLRTLAKLSLQKSDNTALYVIANRIGRETSQNILQEFGLKQTSLANNKTSASDMRLLFTKIYKREVASEALTRELLDFMQDTDFEDRLSAKLPDEITVSHKTGDGMGFVHDVGIIEHKGKHLFVGILASDIGEKEQETKQTIADIAKTLVDAYFKEE